MPLAMPPGFRSGAVLAFNDQGVILLKTASRDDVSWFLCSARGARKLPDRIQDTPVVDYVDLNDLGWVAGVVREETVRDEAPERGFLVRFLR